MYVVAKAATGKDNMATKQARELVAGDVVSIDGRTRVTVARVYPAFGGVAVGVEWSSGRVSHFQPHDVLTVTHASTIGGAL